MRRKDRELTKPEDILRIIKDCRVCRIAMVGQGRPYIVPMNFGYEFMEGTLSLFFHCAGSGKKIDILKENDDVCFEMDCGHDLKEGPIACEYGFSYASVIGNGKAEFVEDFEGKSNALLKIMEHQTGKTDFLFDENIVKETTVFRIVSTEYSGKRKK
jgi:nitroimidazol reductase NimA-like FMN-containing flavoprotein (pyridoxamine 5'-phosphate oxidase superfamily)